MFGREADRAVLTGRREEGGGEKEDDEEDCALGVMIEESTC